MHEAIPRKEKHTRDEYVGPRKANEYIQMLACKPPPAMLFDEFWREGEVALLFGPSGAGKSMLAVQLAEALGRGRGIGGFRMPTKRQRVLYVDLKLSDRQFTTRYDKYRFSENVIRWRPATTEGFGEALRKTLAETRAKCVLIDDLSAFRETSDGTRDTMRLMRELVKICDVLDISILALAASRAPRTGSIISERELMRSHILCDAADSVFAIAAHPSCPYSRTIVQTRSVNPMVWTASNAPVCWIEPTEEGLPGLVFEKRFTAPVDQERNRLICEIRRRWNAGESFRKMAVDLGISSATASRLCKKWRPGLEPTAMPPPPTPPEPRELPGPPESIEGEFEKPAWIDIEEDAAFTASESNDKDDQLPQNELGVETVPAARQEPVRETAEARPPYYADDPPQPDTPRSILLAHGCTPGHDTNGREIFIESEDSNGKRQVWYRFDRKNSRSNEEVLKRMEFKSFGPNITTVDGPMCPFNTS